jgi:hypothetical protein
MRFAKPRLGPRHMGFSLWRSTFAVPESQIEPTATAICGKGYLRSLQANRAASVRAPPKVALRRGFSFEDYRSQLKRPAKEKPR